MRKYIKFKLQIFMQLVRISETVKKMEFQTGSSRLAAAVMAEVWLVV